MQSEALSMKMIAVVTLIFLPLGTVASVFGTQFISQKDNQPNHIIVSNDFWLLWLIAVPLTLFVVLLWRVWYHDERAQLRGEMSPRKDGERGYMGWKSLKNSLSTRRKKQTNLGIQVQDEYRSNR
jgi:heme/copper-type cytochrome/quinol oxidase subunit 2